MPAISFKHVMEALTKRLPREIGNLALEKSRNTCPIQTGELYRSLYVDIHADGFELGATVSYASDVEEGTQPVILAGGGSWTGKWNRFKRTSKNGIVHMVRKHRKTYENKKPVETSGTTNKATQEWSTRSATSGREGTFFMKNALEASIPEIIDKVLTSLGASKTKSRQKKQRR